MSEFVKMRISQDKLPSAIGLGLAVPNGRSCKPRAKGELREPGDKVRREVVAELLACSEPGRKGCETPLAQVVTALEPWWKRNQDSTFFEVLADLIAPRGKDALAAEVNEKVDRLTRERASPSRGCFPGGSGYGTATGRGRSSAQGGTTRAEGEDEHDA